MWYFGGHGKLKEYLDQVSNTKHPEHASYKENLYRTTESQEGNATNPDTFLKERIATKRKWPEPIPDSPGNKDILAPGGDQYEWKEAETEFEVPENGKYIIKITASAKNQTQNNSTDDDDLRVEINDHDMRKGPHDGFNIASSWNGANLK